MAAPGNTPGGFVQPSSINLPTPNRGPAPNPVRQFTYAEAGGQAAVNLDTPTGTMRVQAGGQPAPTHLSSPSIQTSAPPLDPRTSAELALLRVENAGLKETVGQLGTTLKEIQRSMEEQRFRLELGAVPQAPPQALPPLPPGLDPEAPMSWGQFMQVAQNVFPALEGQATASAIRSSWGISASEEAEILQMYPQLQAHREPERTRLIQRAATLRQQQAQTAAPTPGPAPVASPPITRPAAPTVPLVEGTSTPTMGEPNPEDELQAAQRRYQEASQMPVRSQADAKRRLAAMKQAALEAETLQGVTEEMRREGGFRYRG